MKAPRTALVTGAASGIGLAVARQLVGRGVNTVMADRSEGVLMLAHELSQQGRSAAGYVVELSDVPKLKAWLDELLARYQVVDIVVNNAGIHPKKEGGKYLVEEIELAQWHQVLEVNLTAPFLICSALLPAMKKQGWGRIVNIGSGGARNRPRGPSAHYVASKAAIAGLTRCIAEEGAALGITANCLAPGPVKTGLTASSSPEAIAALTQGIPIGRYGTPEEIAAAVDFLVSDEASFITGTVMDVNGGSNMN